MRALQQTQSGSSKTVLTAVVIVIAVIIAFVVGIFLVVRFFEKRRRMRANAAVEAGKSLNRKNPRHKRRFSQTEYDTLPLKENVRKRRFSTGLGSDDVWGNLMDATLYDQDSQIMSEEAITRPTSILIEKSYRSSEMVFLNNQDDTSDISTEILEPDTSKNIFDSANIPIEICDPDELRDICNIADIPGKITLSSTPILIQDSISKQARTDSPIIDVTLSDFPMFPAADHSARMTYIIPPECRNAELYLQNYFEAAKPLSFDCVSKLNNAYDRDSFPKSFPVDPTNSSLDSCSPASDQYNEDGVCKETSDRRI